MATRTPDREPVSTAAEAAPERRRPGAGADTAATGAAPTRRGNDTTATTTAVDQATATTGRPLEPLERVPERPGPIEVLDSEPADALVGDARDLVDHVADADDDPFDLDLASGTEPPAGGLTRPDSAGGSLTDGVPTDPALPAPDLESLEGGSRDGRTHDAFEGVQGDTGVPGGGNPGLGGAAGFGLVDGHAKALNDTAKAVEGEFNPNYVKGEPLATKPWGEQGQEAGGELGMPLGLHQGGAPATGSDAPAASPAATDDGGKADEGGGDEGGGDEPASFEGGVAEWVKSWFGKSEAELAFARANQRAEWVETVPNTPDSSGGGSDDPPPNDVPVDPEGQPVPDDAAEHLGRVHGDFLALHRAIDAAADAGSEINPAPDGSSTSRGTGRTSATDVMSDPDPWTDLVSQPGPDGTNAISAAPTGTIDDDRDWYFDDAPET